MRKVLLVCAGFFALSVLMFARHQVNENKTRTQKSSEAIVAVLGATDQNEAPIVPEVEPIAPLPVYVTVKSGESLIMIATANNTTTQRLYDANTDISDPSLLNVGQQIRIPSSEEQLAVRTMPAPKPVVTAVISSKPVASNAPVVADGSIWDQMSKCEAGGNWARNSGNGYYGGLQFSLSTWRGVGGQGLPSENSREEQILRAEKLLARSGWGQWPACARKLGLL